VSGDEGWLVSGSTSPDEVRDYYDTLAIGYDTTLAEWGYDAPERASRLLMEGLPDGATAVLDAGCGTGLAGAALRSAGFTGELIGIDLSPASIELARRRGIYTGLTVTDLQQPLELDDRSVDGVICVGVMTYVPDVAAVWGEFCRVTRPGGVIVCTQRDDIWRERQCNAVVDAFERRHRWVVRHLSPPSAYLPGNPDFADAISVRYLSAGVRG
jgi:predicted TPR repeat methyltransferase